MNYKGELVHFRACRGRFLVAPPHLFLLYWEDFLEKTCWNAGGVWWGSEKNRKKIIISI